MTQLLLPLDMNIVIADSDMIVPYDRFYLNKLGVSYFVW